MPGRPVINETLIRPPLRFRFINGGAAGNLTVTGIKVQDRLLYVGGFTVTNGTPDVVASIADLTSEFTISAANQINNTGGTASTNGALFVIWLSVDPKADSI